MNDKPKSFRIADFRISSEYDELETPLFETVVLSKPRKEVWFRTFLLEAATDVFYIYEDRPSSTTFVFMPVIGYEFADDLSAVKLIPFVTRDLNLGLWPIKMDKPGKAPNSWNASAYVAAIEAQSVWIRLRSVQNESVYRAYQAKVDFGEPSFPEDSYEELVQKAFGNNIVESGDHPLVKKLMGAI